MLKIQVNFENLFDPRIEIVLESHPQQDFFFWKTLQILHIEEIGKQNTCDLIYFEHEYAMILYAFT